MGSHQGKMLEVNLTTGETSRSIIDEDIHRKYIGGSGLAAKIFFDRVSPDVDPLSEDNLLLIMTGPLSGTTAPGGSRFSACAKSPLTNMWGESCCGGDFATEMRSAGVDGIICNGASDKPVYLLIEDDKAELKDAADLWGKNTHEITDLLKERHSGKKKARVISIGQAGENKVYYAAIANGKKNFFGRCGMGAVMGSKNLKAIVAVGTGKVTQGLPDEFAAKRKEVVEKAKEHYITDVMKTGGTIGAMDFGVFLGDLPGKNWTVGDMTEYPPKIGGAMLNTEKFLTNAESCRGCLLGCKRVVKIDEGKYKGMAGAGPEYEGAASLGSLLMIDDMAAIIKMNEACNDLGMDVISCGATIAMTMDCWEQGIITADDTDGLELTWGNSDAVLELIKKIAARDGFGATLADGSKIAAEKIGKGADEYAVHVKGMEVPMHDPRAFHGLGLSYATCVRGACHTNDPIYSIEQGIMIWPEIGINGGYEQKASEGKAEIVVIGQNIGQVYNAAVLCYLLMSVLTEQEFVDLLKTASGFDYDIKELMECGERIWMLKRGLNNLMGITAKDDKLPKRIVTPFTDGAAAGSEPQIDMMLKEYYPLRNLDEEGKPQKDKLESLDLSDLAAKL